MLIRQLTEARNIVNGATDKKHQKLTAFFKDTGGIAKYENGLIDFLSLRLSLVDIDELCKLLTGDTEEPEDIQFNLSMFLVRFKALGFEDTEMTHVNRIEVFGVNKVKITPVEVVGWTKTYKKENVFVFHDKGKYILKTRTYDGKEIRLSSESATDLMAKFEAEFKPERVAKRLNIK